MSSISIYAFSIILPITLIFGIFFVYMSFLILRKRPIIIKSQIFIIPFFGFLIFILILLIFVYILQFLSTVTSFYSNTWLSFLLIPLIIFLILTSKKLFGDFMLNNIEEDTLYDSIFETLKKENIQYEEKRGKILLPSLKSEIKINIQSNFNTGILYFNLKDKKIRNTIYNNLKQILINKTFNKFPIIGLFFLMSGIIILAFSVYGYFLQIQASELNNFTEMFNIFIIWIIISYS